MRPIRRHAMCAAIIIVWCKEDLYSFGFALNVFKSNLIRRRRRVWGRRLRVPVYSKFGVTRHVPKRIRPAKPNQTVTVRRRRVYRKNGTIFSEENKADRKTRCTRISNFNLQPKILTSLRTLRRLQWIEKPPRFGSHVGLQSLQTFFFFHKS